MTPSWSTTMGWRQLYSWIEAATLSIAACGILRAFRVYGKILFKGLNSIFMILLSLRKFVVSILDFRRSSEQRFAAVADFGLHRELVTDQVAQRVADMRPHRIRFVQLHERVVICVRLPAHLF